MVTEVKNSRLSYAGTANDVLRKLPGVADVGNGLQVLGRGTPEYYINGRKVHDFSELDQLSSTSIRNVEVVMNPGARYDASVKAVIRINTQKPVGEGFGFDNRLMGDYNKKAGWLDQFNFNYRKNNFDLFGLLFYSDSYYWKTHQAVQDTYLDKHWKQENLTDVESRNRTFTGRLGMNYVFNNNHSLGAYYRVARQPYSKNYMDVYTDVSVMEQIMNLLETLPLALMIIPNIPLICIITVMLVTGVWMWTVMPSGKPLMRTTWLMSK